MVSLANLVLPKMDWFQLYGRLIKIIDLNFQRFRRDLVWDYSRGVDRFSILILPLIKDNKCSMECILSIGSIFQKIDVVDRKPDIHTLLHKVRETETSSLLHSHQHSMLNTLFNVEYVLIVTANIHSCEIGHKTFVTHSGMNRQWQSN